jgi:hypothetical protein
MKIQRQQVYGSTLSITSAPDWDGWLTPHPCCFTPGKRLGTHYTGPVWRGAENIAFTRILFWFSLSTLSMLLCRGCPGFCPSSLLCNTHKTDTSMLQAGFEPELPTSERPQALALDRWDRPPNRPARTETLYRLSYRGPRVFVQDMV